MNSYTSAFLSGEVTTLKDFANVVSKAFGFCNHMSEHGLTAPYVPMNLDKETEYYREHKEELERQTEELKNASLKDIEEKWKRDTKEDITRLENLIALKKLNYKRVVKLIEEIESKHFPEELLPCRKYILRDLIDARDHDCKTDFYEESLEELKNQYSSFNVQEYIERTIRDNSERIEEYKKQIIKTTENVNRNNKLAEEFFNIFKD